MATRIRGIVANLGVRTPELQQGLRSARRDWRTYSRAVQRDVQTLSRVTRLATTAIVGSLALVGRAAFQSADEIAKAARNLEVNVTQYQVLAQAARQSGSNVEALGTAFNTFNRNLEEGRLGTESATRAFTALGLSASNFIGLDFFQQVRLLGPALESVDTSTRIWAAGILLGEENARRLNSTLETLADDALEQITERMVRAGAIIEEDLLPFVEDLNDQFSLLGPAVQAGFLRGLTDAGVEVTDFSGVIGRISQAVEVITFQIVRFAVVIEDNIESVVRWTAAWVAFRVVAFGGRLLAAIGGASIALTNLAAALISVALQSGTTAATAATLTVAATTNTVATTANTAATTTNTVAQAARTSALSTARVALSAATAATRTWTGALFAATVVMRQAAVALLLIVGQILVAATAIGVFGGAVIAVIELFQGGFGPSIGRIIDRIEIRIRLLGNTIDTVFNEIAMDVGAPLRAFLQTLEEVENNLRGLRNATFGRLGITGILPPIDVNTDFDNQAERLEMEREALLERYQEIGGSLAADLAGVYTDASDFAQRFVDRAGAVLMPVADGIRTLFELIRTGDASSLFTLPTDADVADLVREIIERLAESTEEQEPPPNLQDFFNQMVSGQVNLPGTGGRRGRQFDTDFESAVELGTEDFQNSLARGLTAGLREGDFSAVGETLRDSLIRSFTTNLGDSLSDAFTNFLTGVLGGIGQGGTGNSIFAALGGFLPFQDGGFVPGRTGQAVPILAHAGELVLTPEQQRTLGGNVNVTLNVTGNVDAATERAIIRSGERIADVVQAQFTERRLFAG